MKYSMQRQVILDNVNSRFDHPTAEMIYSDVLKKIPNISLGTVYRNLIKLKELHDIESLYIDNVLHYDAKRDTHQHIRCIKCGEIVDIVMPDLDNILKMVNNNIDHIVIKDNICLNGICNSCKNK